MKEEKGWLVYDGGVYDVKNFIPYHPGGELLIKHLLYTDATDHMTKVHPDWVFTEKLPQYYIGEVDEATFPLRSRTKISQKLRDLEIKMREEGLFVPTDFWYAREIIKVILLHLLAFYIVLKFEQSLLNICIGAFVHGHATQQMAFLLHDSSHNEIFRSREANHRMGNFISNIMGGVSITLWKDEHNTHHLVTNHPEHDPDI